MVLLCTEMLPRLEGKTFAVTGTTSGIGYACARTLSELGGRVLLLNRHSGRDDAALERLRAEVPQGSFEPVVCDLANFASVYRAVLTVRSLCHDGLDALVSGHG